MFRRLLPLAALAALLCSFNACERHHPGELPEVQQEHLHPLDAHAEQARPAFPTPPVTGATATPANFFPPAKP
jgi:hypothetical protein